MKPWTVLVLGSGGREHALAKRLLVGDRVGRVVVSPGNGGTRGGGLECDSGEPLQVARRCQPDLVVIGPEQPLCDGVADELRAHGFMVYGPSRAAARLEGSKAFMKEFVTQEGVRTARHVTVAGLAELDDALGAFDAPPVVKATGLCAGKGVVVAETFEVARHAASQMLSGAAFGAAGTTVVLEERLHGQEVSVHAISDGERFLLLPPIQDHKRIGEGDTGPNTGGMGTYGPAPVAPPEVCARIERDVVRPIVSGMARAGTPFQGTLFVNLMIPERGEPSLLEINVRFGDPETQVLMNLLDGDLAELFHSAARGKLAPDAVTVSGRHGLCVVLAAAGYPEAPRSGDAIVGVAEAECIAGVQVYHAGTRWTADGLRTSGGRVLGVTATASELEAAHRAAYRAVSCVRFDGMQFRRDIGHLALGASSSAARA